MLKSKCKNLEDQIVDQSSLIQDLTQQITALTAIERDFKVKIGQMKEKMKDRETRWQDKVSKTKKEAKTLQL